MKRRGRGGTPRLDPVDTAGSDAPGAASAPPSAAPAPRLRSYVYLNLAVWGFLLVQGVVIGRSLASGSMVTAYSVLLALGFLGASIFDFLWLRAGR